MPDPKYPLLIFPKATEGAKTKRPSGVGQILLPSRVRQAERVAPRFNRLQELYDEQRIELRAALEGAPIEQVVVLEVAGSVGNFQNAVAKSGLQWLFDVDGENVAPDDDFRDAKEAAADTPSKLIPTKLYLIVSDQRAIDEILSLWNRWQQQGPAAFATGFKPWVHVFSHLRDIRLWDLRDRVGGDTRTYWQERLEAGDQVVRSEIEFWYSDSEQKNAAWSTGLRTLLQNSGSAVIDEADIPAIHYRAFLADLSRPLVESLLAGTPSPLAVAGQIMFYRPQIRAMVSTAGTETVSSTTQRPVPEGAPVVAVLDGVPLQNHALLGNRIVLDDPNNLQATVPAADRVHGTSMASIVLHGDLSGTSPTIESRVIMHPILVPDPHSQDAPRPELSPSDRLLADLIHIAVKRLVDGAGATPAVAPTVRIINLCIGDLRREFTRSMSPLARLLDWLSWKYRVLFVIPTGNLNSQSIELDVARANFAGLNPDARAAAVLRALEADTQFRRLLSPAEAINGITVGGLYSDASTFTAPPGRFTLFAEPWPCPEGRFGPGFLRGVKPDLVAPGGRRLFGERLGNAHPNAIVQPYNVSTAPGILAAVPSPTPGALNHSKFSAGTSNAAALVSHAAAHAHNAIVQLRVDQNANDALPPMLDAVLLKALIVHTCQWPESAQLEEALASVFTDANERKRRLGRMFGYGALDIDRARGCTDERATLIAVGEIKAEQGLSFRVPLPHALAGKLEWRRLTVTLSWLSPINPRHRDYRRASLWFTLDHAPLKVASAGADWRAARRGTTQHEVWSGKRASAFGENDEIEIIVSCAADAGQLNEPVPYALCVSLEVSEGIDIPIYEQVAARIQAPIAVQP